MKAGSFNQKDALQQWNETSMIEKEMLRRTKKEDSK